MFPPSPSPTRMSTPPVPLLNPLALSNHHFPAWTDLAHSPNEHVFHLNRLETHIAHITFPLPPHRKTVHDFIYLTQGGNRRAKGLHEYETGPGTFIFMPAQQITTHHSLTPDAQGYYCHFDMALLTTGFVPPAVLEAMPFLQFTGHPLVEVPAEAQPRILHLLQQLEQQAINTDSPAALELARVYLLALFFELKGLASSSAATTVSKTAAVRITQAYKDALAQHIQRLQTVAAYAELLAISPNHLNKCVKIVTGRSAQEALDDMVVLEAKTLLRQTDLSIGEIAYRMGKDEQSSFSRFFKQKTGATPRLYRQGDKS